MENDYQQLKKELISLTIKRNQLEMELKELEEIIKEKKKEMFECKLNDYYYQQKERLKK